MTDSPTPSTQAEPGRRRVPLLAGAAIVVVALVVTLVVTTADGDRPVPSGTMPTLGDQFATPPAAPASSAPATPESLPSFSGAPVWTVPLPASVDDVPSVAVTDRGYVLAFRDEVLGLSKTGAEVWRYTPPKVDYFTTRVTGQFVFVGYDNPDDDRWPQPDVLVALDAATGKEVWRETEASFWEVTADTVYTSECRGGQNDRVGDCTLSARDPRTKAVRWQVATYASSNVVNADNGLQAVPTPPYLLIGAYPTGSDSYLVSSHDPATGALRGRGFQGKDGHVGSIDDATATTAVTIDDSDRNPADGCQAVVTGFTAADAGQAWEYTARIPKMDGGRRCARQPVSVNRGRMAVTTKDGAPSVLNVDTGAVEWSAPPGGEAMAASDTTLLVVEPGEDREETAELVAYRVGTAAPLWRAPFSGAADTSAVTMTATRAYVTGYGGDAAGYDLKTGAAWSYGGPVQQEAPGWFAVCATNTCNGYAFD